MTRPAPRAPSRLAVLISGGGRTLFNLLDRIRTGRLNASIDLVIASADTAGAQRARDARLNTHIIRGVIPRSQLESLLNEHRIDWVVLAGYLKLIEVPESYRGRIVNIHPALLPSHGGAGMYGHHVHEAVIKAGSAVSGCTVHLVDDEYDRGPIILQKSCPVLPDDTPETLAARVFELECQAYPEALERLLASGVSPGTPQ
jgi:phosphoribosylglycinamide formyltransferase 1